MVKVIFLFRFRADRDPEDVRRWWLNDHGAITYERTMASPEWKALEEDGPSGLDMTSLMGGFVMEHVMRWDADPDRRPYTATTRVG